MIFYRRSPIFGPIRAMPDRGQWRGRAPQPELSRTNGPPGSIAGIGRNMDSEGITNQQVAGADNVLKRAIPHHLVL